MDPASRPHWHPALYAANARFVSTLGQPVVDLLAPRAGERILDLGCGDGVLTARLQASGCDVVGVDASEEMVAAATRLGLDARVMSGDALTFDGEFDAVFSNAALHWMSRPTEVVAGVFRALRPGGRFVAEMGGAGNIAAIVQALAEALADRGLSLRNPWYFPTADEYRQLLEQHGFIVRQIELFARPTPLPGNIRGWLAAFGAPLLGDLDEADREAVATDVLQRLEPQLRGADGTWIADYVRLRFAADRRR
ncbi:MAG TPA: methyltransferase domain-containing protein [Steroidobacteraceae bacterium]